MNNKKYILRVLIAVIIASLFIIFQVNSNCSAVNNLYTVFGSALLNRYNLIVSIILSILPNMALCFFLAEYIADDFDTLCVYIFTRTGNRCGWMVKKLFKLGGWICLFYLILYLAVLLILTFWNVSFNIVGISGVSLCLLLFEILTAIMLLLPINILSIKIGAIKSYMITMGVYVTAILGGTFAPKSSAWLVMLSPFSQGIYAWHDIQWFMLQLPGNVNANVISGFSLTYSLIYLLIIVTVEICVGAVMIKRMDLIRSQKGD